MATKPFVYQDPYPLGKDQTNYRKIEGSEKYVSVATFDGKEILKVDPEALAILANEAMRDVSFLLRPAHNEQVAKILRDPEASRTTRAWPWPSCATPRSPPTSSCRSARTPAPPPSSPRKGQQVWTGVKDEEWSLQGDLQDLHRREPALLPDRGARHVRGDQHRHQPAGPDRHPGHRRRLLQVPLHGQGRRLRQQDHALPGDQGAAHPGKPGEVPGRAR